MKLKALVKKFGGQAELAKLLGIGQSAVAYWVKKGSIPAKWHQPVLSLANQKGVDMSVNNLIAVDLTETHTSRSLTAPSSPAETRGTELANSVQQFMFYASDEGKVKVQVLLGEETIWVTQQGMADIFDTSKQNISVHLSNIFKELELDKNSTVKEILTVQKEGERSVERRIEYYNLDAIISVGYRVNSYKATQFRRWATTVLKEYLIKGFAMDDERLKQGNQLFGKAYFEELLERIRKIRNSERMLWEKVTDLYTQCSVDYDKNSPITQNFFAQIQNKFHYAITHHTAAEIVMKRADANKQNMGLVHFKNMKKDGVILKSDVQIAKNYLNPDELDELERLVENYLGTAELFAKRRIVMTMKDWVAKLDEFLKFNAYDVLGNFGTVKSDDAKKHAVIEYEKYTRAHEKEFKSDFDRFVEQAKFRKKLS